MTRLKNSLIAILMFLVLPITVFAKTGIVLTANQNTMEVGEEIVVTASTSENAHLFALTATLNFDRNVFEEIDETAFEITNPNVSVSYSDTTNKFGILNKTGEISGELFKIHLKAKKEGNVGDTNIVLTNITSSDGTNKEVYEKASTQVLVTRDAKEGEEIPNNPVFDAEDREEIELKATSTFPISFGITIAIGLLLLYILWLMKSKSPNKKKKILQF